MKIIYNNILPVKGFAAINLFGVLFVRHGITITSRIMNHEQIHTRQMKELLYVFFYIIYVLEWIVKLFRYGKRSYHNISFEREAYSNEYDGDYLKYRKQYSFFKYL